MEFDFPGGRVRQEATSVVLVNNTLKVIDTAVPDGKRWVVLSIKAMNPDNVDRTVSIRLYKEALKTNEIALLLSQSLSAAGAERGMWPNTIATHAARSIAAIPGEVLVAGNTINIQWAAGGASAGATDADGLVIEYLETDQP